MVVAVRGALFAAGERGACGACGARGAVFVAGGERGALFVPGVRARGAGFGCLGAEFRARSHPCGTGAAHSGIVIKYTLSCLQLAADVD